VSDISSLEQADVALGVQLASRRHDPLVHSFVKVGTLGDQGPLYAAGLGVMLVGLVGRRARLVRAGVSVFCAVGVAHAAKTAVKKLIKRTRPHKLMEQGRYVSGAGGSEEKPEQSFPSGHMAATVAAARALSDSFPGSTPWTTAASGVIALARLAKGAHWPADIIAGILIGHVSEKVSGAALRMLGVLPEPPRRR